MKLESLKETKFKDAALKREQMFRLNGGGTITSGGSGCYQSTVYPYRVWNCDYAYDSTRTNADGSTFTTYHNRTNHVEIKPENCIGL